MKSDERLDMEMAGARRWPAPVRLGIRIDHPKHPPEEWHLDLHADATAQAVRVMADTETGDPRADGRRLLWHGLPGRTLRQRSLAAAATFLFDSVKMLPRISGLPLWSTASLRLVAAGQEMHATEVELRTGSGTARATVRHRYHRDDPWTERALQLNRWDADPVRALLRLAMVLPERRAPRPPQHSPDVSVEEKPALAEQH